MNWPAGMGGQFEGIYDLVDPALMVPGGDASRMYGGERIAVEGLDDPRLAAKLSADAFALLKEETELESACSAPFEAADHRHGRVTERQSVGQEKGGTRLVDLGGGGLLK